VPGSTTFRIYLAGFAKNADIPLRLFRCIPQSASDCLSGSTHTYATTLTGKTDSSGQGVYSLPTRSSDKPGAYVVLIDDMINNGAQVFNRGKAWFCTTKTGCKTE
jgi:hypothetical protein